MNLFSVQRGHEESSDDEVGSESPLDEVGMQQDYSAGSGAAGSAAGASGVFPPSSLRIRERTRHDSGTRSDTSYENSLFYPVKQGV